MCLCLDWRAKKIFGEWEVMEGRGRKKNWHRQRVCVCVAVVKHEADRLESVEGEKGAAEMAPGNF